MPGPKIPIQRKTVEARTVPMTPASVTSSSPVNASVTAVNKVEPMPMMIASTISFMPEVMTLPRTRSARNAVLFQSANGTRMNPASVVSLNSRIAMKSWTARMKKAARMIAQAIIRTAIRTKFSKKAIGPRSSPAASRSGTAAVNPTPAMKPGRIRSPSVSVPEPALMPSAAKLSNRMPERSWKLPIT